MGQTVCIVAYMEPLTNPEQLRRSIAYFSQREKAFREKADAERSKLRDCVVSAVKVHGMSELEASKLAGVTRQTVRTWCGK